MMTAIINMAVLVVAFGTTVAVTVALSAVLDQSTSSGP